MSLVELKNAPELIPSVKSITLSDNPLTVDNSTNPPTLLLNNIPVGGSIINGVTSVNDKTGRVSIIQGTNINIDNTGNDIVISAQNQFPVSYLTSLNGLSDAVNLQSLTPTTLNITTSGQTINFQTPNFIAGLTAGNEGISIGGTATDKTVSNEGVISVSNTDDNIEITGTNQNPVINLSPAISVNRLEVFTETILNTSALTLKDSYGSNKQFVRNNAGFPEWQTVNFVEYLNELQGAVSITGDDTITVGKSGNSVTLTVPPPTLPDFVSAINNLVSNVGIVGDDTITVGTDGNNNITLTVPPPASAGVSAVNELSGAVGIVGDATITVGTDGNNITLTVPPPASAGVSSVNELTGGVGIVGDSTITVGNDGNNVTLTVPPHGVDSLGDGTNTNVSGTAGGQFIVNLNESITLTSVVASTVQAQTGFILDGAGTININGDNGSENQVIQIFEGYPKWKNLTPTPVVIPRNYFLNSTSSQTLDQNVPVAYVTLPITMDVNGSILMTGIFYFVASNNNNTNVELYFTVDNIEYEYTVVVTNTGNNHQQLNQIQYQVALDAGAHEVILYVGADDFGISSVGGSLSVLCNLT